MSLDSEDRVIVGSEDPVRSADMDAHLPLQPKGDTTTLPDRTRVDMAQNRPDEVYGDSRTVSELVTQFAAGARKVVS